jgi:arsenate reductase (thioredoxin)
VKRYHWGFDDPAKATGSEEEIFAVFRRMRDEIGKVFGAYAAGLWSLCFRKALSDIPLIL